MTVRPGQRRIRLARRRPGARRRLVRTRCPAVGVLFVALAVTAGLWNDPPRAHAYCLAVDRAKVFAAVDVVVDAVALSGPRAVFVRDTLISPARFYVLRYHKGHGPRVIEVETSNHWTRLFPPRPGGFAEDFTPNPSQTWRIYGRTRDGGPSATAGLREPSLCNTARLLTDRHDLRPLARARLRDRAARHWNATLVGDRRAMRCVRLNPMDHVTYGSDECVAGLRRGRSLLAWNAYRTDEVAETAIAVAGNALKEVTVRTPAGSTLARIVAGRLALLVLDTYVPQHLIAVDVLHADGQREAHNGAALRTVTVPDPVTGESWTASTVTTRDRSAPRCTLVARSDVPSETGVCSSSAQEPFYFRIGAHTVDSEQGRSRTVLTGGVDRSVESVSVDAPTGRSQLKLASRGRAFLAVYPDSVPPTALTITIRFKDGSSAVFTGREQVNIARP